MTTPTDDYVARKIAALPHVLAIPHDIISVLEGRPITMTIRLPEGVDWVNLVDHDEIVVRLFTADEFMAAHKRSCESLGIPPTLTHERAVELTKPLS